jgi:hypothetical protein
MQNRLDHHWYHETIRCEPVGQGWQITRSNSQSPDSSYVVSTLPEYFVIHIFNGLLDIDNWRSEPLPKTSDNEF